MGRFFTRRWLVRAGIAVVVLAALWSSLALIVPPTLQEPGRRDRARDARPAPDDRRCRLQPVDAVAPGRRHRPGRGERRRAAAAEIRQLRSRVSVSWVFRLAPIIDRLEIDTPRVRLTHLAEGRYDIDDVLARVTAGAGEGSDEPARFALHNIVVHGGAADFVDQPLKTTHRLRDFELGVPFLSALPSEREINVEPRLAFTLDGSRFDSAAVATPFAERGGGTVKIQLDRFDVGPWLGYLPPSLPLRLQSGLVSADLSLAFEQRPKLSLRLHGDVGVADLKVADADARDLLQVGSVKVRIDDLRPLERTAKVARIDIDAPHVLGVRNAAGKVNLLLAAETPSGAAVPVAPVPLPTTRGECDEHGQAVEQQAGIGGERRGRRGTGPGLEGEPGRVGHPVPASSTGATRPRRPGRARRPGLQLRRPGDRPGRSRRRSSSRARASSAPPRTRSKLAFSGEGNAAGATVKVGLDELPLVVARPYLQGLLRPPLAGALSCDLTLQWKPGDGAPQLRVDARRIAVARLLLGEPKTPELAAEQIELLDAARRHRRPERGHRQSWRCRRRACGSTAMPRAAGMPPPGRARSRRPRPRRPRPPRRWGRSARTGAGGVCGGCVHVLAPDARHFGDRQGPGELHRPQPRGARRVRSPRACAAGARLGTRRRGSDAVPAAGPVAVPAGASGRAVGAGVVGNIDARGELKGSVAGVPQSAKATLALEDLPLHLLDPYSDALVELDVQKAQTSFKGTVAWERTRRRRQPGAARRRQHRRLPRRQPGGRGLEPAPRLGDGSRGRQRPAAPQLEIAVAARHRRRACARRAGPGDDRRDRAQRFLRPHRPRRRGPAQPAAGGARRRCRGGAGRGRRRVGAGVRPARGGGS